MNNRFLNVASKLIKILMEYYRIFIIIFLFYYPPLSILLIGIEVMARLRAEGIIRDIFNIILNLFFQLLKYLIKFNHVNKEEFKDRY